MSCAYFQPNTSEQKSWLLSSPHSPSIPHISKITLNVVAQKPEALLISASCPHTCNQSANPAFHLCDLLEAVHHPSCVAAGLVQVHLASCHPHLGSQQQPCWHLGLDDTLSWGLGVGKCRPMHCRVLSSIPSLCSFNAYSSCSHCPLRTLMSKTSPGIAKYVLGQNLHKLKTNALFQPILCPE